MSNQPERPDLSRRRKPQAAADERVDPIDYRPQHATEDAPAPQPEQAAEPARQVQSVQSTQLVQPVQSIQPIQLTPGVAAPAQRGRPRREVAVPFSTRLAPDVLELIDAATAAGEAGGTIRSVVEAAIREKYQSKNVSGREAKR